MKVKNLVGQRFKERPADCVLDSHALMVRGGYIKNVGSGIFSEFPALRRVTSKIEALLREEMDAIDGQEVIFPVVMPAEFGEETGRYENTAGELLRFRDRMGTKMVLAMTHEEAAIQLVKEYAQSYQQYPFMVYQIQRTFRDEEKPKAGMMRMREFTMQDAYSFHTSQEDLDAYYEKCRDAYSRIFKRVGMKDVIAAVSDRGDTGDGIAHEYMLLHEAGDTSVVVCEACDYRANLKVAENVVKNETKQALAELVCIETPDCKTIEDVCRFLNSDVLSSCKAVVYQKNTDDTYVAAFVRGDYEVNETKLEKLVGATLCTAEIVDDTILTAGYIGPYKLSDKVEFYCDVSLKGIDNLVAGANKEGFHYAGLNLERDMGEIAYVDIAVVKEGSICPCCGKPALTVQKGIKLGNTARLDTRLCENMQMQYVDKDGENHKPLMGGYQIGIERLAAAVCEARHDDYGPIWPISIAPWEVHVCCIRPDDEAAKHVADSLYEELKKQHVEVIYDDRAGVRGGQMFADADLLGVPIRAVISPRNLKENKIEITTRDKSVNEMTDVSDALAYILALKERLYNEIND